VTTGLSRTEIESRATGAAHVGRLERAQSWLDREYHVRDEQLGVIRVLYCVFVLFVIGVPSFTWIANTPALLFDPPLLSVADLLSGWPSAGALWILSLALVVSFLLLLFGFLVPTMSVLASALLIAGSNLQFSFGKIDHNVLLVLAPLAMAGSGWGNRYTLSRAPAGPNRSGLCLGTFAVVVGFAMFTAGFQKLTTGWLDLSTQASYGHLIQNFYGNSHGVLLAPLAMHIKSTLAWEGLDWATVAFELLFVVAVIRRAWFRAWIVLAVLFHTSTLLVLDIGFAINFSAYLLFVDWPQPSRFTPSRQTTWLLAGCATALVLGVWWQGTRPNQPLFLQMTPSVANYVVARVVGAANMNDTTLEILPTALAVLATAALLVGRPRRSSSSLA
jgi:hypothetical protein